MQEKCLKNLGWCFAIKMALMRKYFGFWPAHFNCHLDIVFLRVPLNTAYTQPFTVQMIEIVYFAVHMFEPV